MMMEIFHIKKPRVKLIKMICTKNVQIIFINLTLITTPTIRTFYTLILIFLK